MRALFQPIAQWWNSGQGQTRSGRGLAAFFFVNRKTAEQKNNKYKTECRRGRPAAARYAARFRLRLPNDRNGIKPGGGEPGRIKTGRR